MTDARAAFDPDRLPWLPDERAPARHGRRQPLLLWGVLGLLLVAALSYWAGTRSNAPADPQPSPSQPFQLAPADQPQPVPAPVVAPAPPPPVSEVAPVAQPSAEVDRSRAVEREAPAVREPVETDVAEPATAAPDRPAQVAPKPPVPAQRQPAVQAPARLQAWPADISQGASGRMVRIGTFSSRLQAKRAWSRVVRVYPGMKRLRAVVAPVPSLRDGRTYYRLQFGTTSHAHSAVLCQRMRMVGQSCVLVGL